MILCPCLLTVSQTHVKWQVWIVASLDCAKGQTVANAVWVTTEPQFPLL